MKAHIVNLPTARSLVNKNGPRPTRKLWKRPLAVSLILVAFLLMPSIAVHAQNPPDEYTAQADGIFHYPPGPSGMATGSSGAWSFTAEFPDSYAYHTLLLGDNCWNCIQEGWSSFAYYSGGSFTLGDGIDTFTGIFTSGYGYGYAIEQLLSSDMGLHMYYTGEWNTGLKQAGVMDLYETQNTGIIIGTAGLSFGPAPEPGSILLFGSGIVGLAGLLRRKLLS